MAQRKTARKGKPKAVSDVMPFEPERERSWPPAEGFVGRAPDDQGPQKPVDDDLMIFDEAGNFYRIKKEQYLQHKVPRDTPELWQMTEQMEFLIRQGVVLADIPQGKLEGVDCACYLVNLAGIRHVPPK
jgi:hypothetical protein